MLFSVFFKQGNQVIVEGNHADLLKFAALHLLQKIFDKLWTCSHFRKIASRELDSLNWNQNSTTQQYPLASLLVRKLQPSVNTNTETVSEPCWRNTSQSQSCLLWLSSKMIGRSIIDVFKDRCNLKKNISIYSQDPETILFLSHWCYEDLLLS